MKIKFKPFHYLIIAISFWNNSAYSFPKIYAYYTDSHIALLNNWFLPSLKSLSFDFDIILEKVPQDCPDGQFYSPGWDKAMLRKVDLIIRGIKENNGKFFIYSDIDIQFFYPFKKAIEKIIEEKTDMLIQRQTTKNKFCGGFMIIKGNEKTLKLWQVIKNKMLTSEKMTDEETLLNKLLKKSKQFKDISWKVLPDTFFSPGVVLSRSWNPGEDIQLPKNIALHHANWTVGIENKILQLEYVKNKVYRTRNVLPKKNAIIYLGNLRNTWTIPHHILSSNPKCICFGMHKNLEFEIGVLAFSGGPIKLIGEEEEETYLKKTQQAVQQKKLVYVSYEKVHQISSSRYSKVTFAKHDFNKFPLDKSNTSNNDILKVESKYIPGLWEEKFLEKINHPRVICLNLYGLDQEKIAHYLFENNYTLFCQNNSHYTFLKNSSDIVPIEDIQSKKINHSCILSSHEDLFKEEPVPTERTVRDIFIEEFPFNKLVYVSKPWSCLINQRILNEVKEKNDFTISSKLDGFTVCQHTSYEKILPYAKKIGIKTVFTPHVDKVYIGIDVQPFPHYPVNGVDSAPVKDIWYSFIGAKRLHYTRRKLLEITPSSQDVILKSRDHWHFSRDVFNKKANTKKEQAYEKNEYQDVLSRTRFSLCPRGAGPSTIRFWESLQAGSIPILISNDMKLPQNINWNECIIRISEEEVIANPNIIEETLKEISPEKEIIMRRKCFEAFHLLCEGKNFVNTIMQYYHY